MIKGFMKKNRRRIAISVPLFFISMVLVSLLSNASLGSPEDPSKTVVDALERAPTQWAFYAIVAVLVGSWLMWRCYLHVKLRKRFKSEYRAATKDGPKTSRLVGVPWASGTCARPAHCGGFDAWLRVRVITRGNLSHPVHLTADPSK